MMPGIFEVSESNPTRLRIDEQIAVVSHEIAMRETLYTKWVRAGRSTKGFAQKTLS